MRWAEGFKVFTAAFNLFSGALIGYLFWKCVFIQYVTTGQGIDEFSKFADENGVQTLNFVNIGMCCQGSYFKVTDSRFRGSLP